jgi:hypothetical protein
MSKIKCQNHTKVFGSDADFHVLMFHLASVHMTFHTVTLLDGYKSLKTVGTEHKIDNVQ